MVKRVETFSALHRAALWSARLYGIWQICYENSRNPAVQCLHTRLKFSVLFPSQPLDQPRVEDSAFQTCADPVLTVNYPKPSDRLLIWVWDVQLKKQETAIQDEVIIFIGHFTTAPYQAGSYRQEGECPQLWQATLESWHCGLYLAWREAKKKPIRTYSSEQK